MCLVGCTEHTQLAFDKKIRSTILFGLCFVPSHCKMLLRDCTSVVPNLIFDVEELITVERFNYLISYLTKNGDSVRREHPYIAPMY